MQWLNYGHAQHSKDQVSPMSEAHENTRIRQLTDAAAHWEHKYANARQYNRNLEDRNKELESQLERCRAANVYDGNAHRRVSELETELAISKGREEGKQLVIDQLEAALKAAEWSFNHKRCVVCAGWTGDSESYFFHAPSCIVGKSLGSSLETKVEPRAPCEWVYAPESNAIADCKNCGMPIGEHKMATANRRVK